MLEGFGVLPCTSMNTTKHNHSCIRVETNGARILVDPGNLSLDTHGTERELDIILYTHEHSDHLHVESLESLLTQNPKATVVCNQGVAAHLAEVGIEPTIVEGTAEATVAGVSLRAFDSPHAEIYEDFGQVQHTGYLVDGRLFLAGDSFTVPDFAVEILAPAIIAPFCALRDAVEMIKAMQPSIALSMHDGQLNEAGITLWHTLFPRLVAESGVPTTTVPLPAGAEWRE